MIGDRTCSSLMRCQFPVSSLSSGGTVHPFGDRVFIMNIIAFHVRSTYAMEPGYKTNPMAVGKPNVLKFIMCMGQCTVSHTGLLEIVVRGLQLSNVRHR